MIDELQTWNSDVKYLYPEQQYLTQLENYKKAVQKIYPDHQITAKILWIKFLKFNQEI